MTGNLTHPAAFSRVFREQGLTGDLVVALQQVIYHYYDSQGRDLPWRRTRDPYAILVSEMMLQQTQVERVLLKYGPFLERFPDLARLAQAPLAEILTAWQGLGYNRRAKALQGIARRVTEELDGRLPADRRILESLPGIGPGTAGALLAFAFEQPVAFLETNIRRVFLYWFYPEEEAVPDRRLLPLVLLTLDAPHVRRWYYALMDYGAGLKKQVPNPNRRSAHYSRQSPFAGSDRDIRSRILRLLLQTDIMTEAALLARIPVEAARLRKILAQLEREQFLISQAGGYQLATGL